jgi:hypothetical protein
MRAALLSIIGLLLVATAAAADSPVCRHLDRQIEHFEEMSDRADKLGSDLWEDRADNQIAVLRKQRKAAGCKETAAEAAERTIAELTALLKAAAQGAATFFSGGMM